MGVFEGVSLLVAMVLGLAGGVLLMRGLTVGRVGRLPRCRGCGYNLTGNASGVCPECGAQLARSAAVVRGRWQWRPRLVVAGVLVMALAATALLVGQWAQRAYARHGFVTYKPAWWLMRNARTGAAPVAEHAADELLRRYQTELYSPAEQTQVINFALDEQGAALTHRPETQTLIDLLEAARQADDLTPQQKQQYYAQLMTVHSPRTRREWVVGKPWQVDVAVFYRAPRTQKYAIHYHLTAMPR